MTDADDRRVGSSERVNVWMIAYLAIIGNFVLSILPGFIGVLIDYVGLEDRYAGAVASANLAGVAAGALVATALLGRASARGTVLGALVMMLASEWVCAGAQGPITLILTRFVSGFGGGLASSLCVGLIAQTANPQRTYSNMIFLQFLFGALGLTVLPFMVQAFGLIGMYIMISAVVITGILITWLFPTIFPATVQTQPVEKVKDGALRNQLMIILVAFALFQCAMFTAWAYMDRIGLKAGLSDSAVGATLGLGGSGIGMVGALFAAMIGLRYGLLKPAGIGCMVALLSLVAILFDQSATVYVVANIIFGIAWAFVVPFYITRQAEMDPAGKVAALGAFVSMIGIAVGPLLAAMVISSETYLPSLTLGMVILIVSFVMLRMGTPEESLFPARQT